MNKTIAGELCEALFDVLDALGALDKPYELTGWGIHEDRANEIVSLAKSYKEAMDAEKAEAS